MAAELDNNISNSSVSNSNTDGSPSSCKKKRTIGEELWEVHLHRHNDDDEDKDVVHRKHEESEEPSPKRSLGEELWQVHLQRSQGVEPDYDLVDNNDTKSQPAVAADTTAAKDDSTKEDEEHVIQLRNRTISIPSH